MLRAAAVGSINLRQGQIARVSGASGHGGRGQAHHGSARARTGPIAVVDLESKRGGWVVRFAQSWSPALPGRANLADTCGSTLSRCSLLLRWGTPTPHFHPAATKSSRFRWGRNKFESADTLL